MSVEFFGSDYADCPGVYGRAHFGGSGYEAVYVERYDVAPVERYDAVPAERP